MLTLGERTMEMFSLMQTSPGQKFSSVTTILPTGLSFPIPAWILQQMLRWSGCLLPYLEQVLKDEDALKHDMMAQLGSSALRPMSGAWPEGRAEWLCCVPVQSMLGCSLVHFSGSGLQVHIKKELLLTALTGAQDVAPAPAVVPEPPEELGLPPRDAPEPEPLEASAAAAAPRAELEDAGPGDMHDASSWAAASRATETAGGPEPSCPGSGPLEEPGNKQVSVSTFPARLVAEQLTFMDAELFLELVPYHCRGPLWSKRNTPGHEHVCPTAQAIESQFISVANCVLSTCLGELSPPARARMLEYWILVAQECQRLHNWASTYAILCALQNPVICRLRKSWRHVSWWSQRKLKALCRQARKHRRCKPPQEEQCCSFVSCLRNLRRPQGVVPFLGPFLQEMESLDREMEDFVGEVINKEKLTKETKILLEIVELQEATENYRLQPHKQFLTWFQDLELITMEKSYILSIQREPFEAFNYQLILKEAPKEATVHTYFNRSFSCAYV